MARRSNISQLFWQSAGYVTILSIVKRRRLISTSLLAARLLRTRNYRRQYNNIGVLSHLHYPIVLFSDLKKSLQVTLNKQLNWGLKACFSRTKFDRTTDLKIKHRILPVEYLIKYRVIIYFLKLLKADLTAFGTQVSHPKF